MPHARDDLGDAEARLLGAPGPLRLARTRREALGEQVEEADHAGERVVDLVSRRVGQLRHRLQRRRLALGRLAALALDHVYEEPRGEPDADGVGQEQLPPLLGEEPPSARAERKERGGGERVRDGGEDRRVGQADTAAPRGPAVHEAGGEPDGEQGGDPRRGPDAALAGAVERARNGRGEAGGHPLEEPDEGQRGMSRVGGDPGLDLDSRDHQRDRQRAERRAHDHAAIRREPRDQREPPVRVRVEDEAAHQNAERLDDVVVVHAPWRRSSSARNFPV